jgi:hypothetical protein
MDKSNRYEDLMVQEQAVLSADNIADLRSNYQFLLIKGFLGDVLPEPFDSYFSEQTAFFKSNRIEHLRLEPDSGFGTQKLPENNIVAIKTTITELLKNSPDKHMVIISHSKGGLDTLETLLSGVLNLDKEIAGWIAMQAPFAGTPLANMATGTSIGSEIVGVLFDSVFGGDKEVLLNMRTDVRQQYLADHSLEIAELCNAINILSFASQISATDRSLLSANQKLIKVTTHQDNDGVVPQQSAILTSAAKPCCPFVCTSHVDHFYPILKQKFASHGNAGTEQNKRKRLFTALLKIWLENR